MSLCDQCPICKEDLSSRHHYAEWTIRTTKEDGKEIVRANLRVTCRGGQRLTVWVEGTVKFFYMDRFAEKYQDGNRIKREEGETSYPMTDERKTIQIDCRNDDCRFYRPDGGCTNMAPAITLNPSGRYVCWSKDKEEKKK